jgi:hypothetical protein
MKHDPDLSERDPRMDVLAQCEGKDRLSYEQAKKIAKRMTARGRVVTEYRCHACSQWHVGQPSPIKRIRRQKKCWPSMV